MSGKDRKEIAKDLPKNWEVFHSKKSNRVYYYNNVTKTTQWQHPSLGEKIHKHDDKSKKRKAPVEEPGKVKDGKTKEPNQKLDQTTRTRYQLKIKKEKTDSEGVLSKTTIPKPLKLARLPLKFTIKKRAEIAKTNFQAPNPTEVSHTNRPQVPKPAETAPAHPQAPKPCNGQKPPALVRSKSEVVTTKKLTKLQPLTRTKSVGEGSDSGVSDSSDRILAWLADTSRFNFKNHPVPNVVIKENPTSEKPKLLIEKPSESKTGKQQTDKQKNAILQRVGTNTEATKEKSDNILDKLLPKHPQTHPKQRYAPYKLTLPISKQNKPHKSNQSEQVKNAKERNTLKLNISEPSNAVKKSDSKPTANENGVSPGITTSVVRNCSEDPTPNQNSFLAGESGHEHSSWVTSNNSSVNVHGLGTGAVNNLQNGLNECQQFVSNGEVQRQQHNEVVQHEDEVLSMEEGARSVVSVPLSETDVADMEIDNAEQFAKEIVKELKEMRGSVFPIEIPKDKMAMQVSTDGFEGVLYIVLDTNVMLSHLKFVVELKDFPIPGVGMPILVIPWIVIQELDSLKENKWKCHDTAGGDFGKTAKVDTLARNAIKFLNSSFQKSDPRVRGQTVEEAAERVGNLQAESNDDRILQCCLLFNERAQNGSCVLFSNDVNLCNKAMVNGIKAFNHQKLLPGLKDLFQCGAIVKQHSEEYSIQLAVEQDQARRRQKADDILCELQIILREGLSYIIESEMKQAYDDLWLDIVHIKPPWTLIDVLQLMDKHWIAVFGHVLKRDRKTLVDKLRQKFDDKKGMASSLQFSSEMLQLALEIFQSFAAHSNYDDAIPKCLAAVNVLVQKCQQFQAEVSMNSANGQPSKCLTYPTNMNVAIENNNGSANLEGDTGVRANYGLLHEEVTNTFNLIWTAVTQFSTQIFTALGYPNTISEGRSQDFPKASKEEAIAFLHVLCPKLSNLVHSIQNVLRDPWEKASQNNTLFIQLEQTITMFLNEVLSQENNATAEKLFSFCQDASMRTSLVQGLSQLDRASAMLQHCASCVAPSSAMPQTSES